MSENKKHLRKHIIQLRDSINAEEKKSMDDKIYENLINCTEYQVAKTIFIFVSYVSEVDTKRMIEHSLAEGKKVCVPKVKSMAGGLSVHQIKDISDLEIGFRGILEPKSSCSIIEGDEIDLIIMPGIGFDMNGGRIGYGGGFYDRFILELKKDIKKIAIAYEMQVLDNIPMLSHDARIDGIITEKRVSIFK